jgi:hypothetical protein
MGKSRTLADTVSTGGPLADGVISISDVSGLQAALDAKSSLVSGTAITTSGASSYEFTGIPASTKNIRLLFRNVSPDDSNGVISVKLGTAGGYLSTGYSMTGHSFNNASVNPFTATTSFPVWTSGAGPYMFTGIMDLSEIAPNVWVESGQLKASGTISLISTGDISLGAELTKIQVVTSAGLFDGGTINILYE